jgi:anti-anti-sigma regulatory factor
MKIVQQGATVNVSDVQELAAGNTAHFQSAIRAAMPSRPNRIDIDLSQTEFLDCNGVGALVALRKCARQRNARSVCSGSHISILCFQSKHFDDPWLIVVPNQRRVL